MTAVASEPSAQPAAQPASQSASQPAADGARPEGDAPSALQPGAFRAVMRHHVKGVAVITAGGATPVGFCATSLTSVSLDPPLVSFTAGLHTDSWAVMEREQHVVVHLLAEGQEETARRFARTGEVKFGPATRWHRDARGLPVLDDVLARFVVAPVSVLPVADHALVIGRVLEAAQMTGGRPLVHHDGDFVRLATA